MELFNEIGPDKLSLRNLAEYKGGGVVIPCYIVILQAKRHCLAQ